MAGLAPMLLAYPAGPAKKELTVRAFITRIFVFGTLLLIAAVAAGWKWDLPIH